MTTKIGDRIQLCKNGCGGHRAKVVPGIHTVIGFNSTGRPIARDQHGILKFKSWVRIR